MFGGIYRQFDPIEASCSLLCCAMREADKARVKVPHPTPAHYIFHTCLALIGRWNPRETSRYWMEILLNMALYCRAASWLAKEAYWRMKTPISRSGPTQLHTPSKLAPPHPLPSAYYPLHPPISLSSEIQSTSPVSHRKAYPRPPFTKFLIPPWPL